MAAACGAGFLWGTGALVVNLLIVRHGLSAENISFWRFVVGGAALLLVFGRPALLRRWPAHAPLLVMAGACMALYVLCWFLAIARIGTALVVLQHGSASAEVALRPLLEGVALSVASALLYAVFSVVSGGLSLALGAGPATTGLTLVAAATMGLAALYTPLVWPQDLPPEAWLLYLGLVTAAIALLAFSWGAARLSPTALTVATLVEPLTAVLLAAWLLGEAMTGLQWLGAAGMLAGIWGLGRHDARRMSEASEASDAR